jgi:hypothetical protein
LRSFQRDYASDRSKSGAICLKDRQKNPGVSQRRGSLGSASVERFHQNSVPFGGIEQAVHLWNMRIDGMCFSRITL